MPSNTECPRRWRSALDCECIAPPMSIREALPTGSIGVRLAGKTSGILYLVAARRMQITTDA